MGRMKRVRFADLDADHTVDQRPGASPKTAKTTVASDFENPKTSEYRSYKKLREDAGQNLCCYQQRKDASHFRKLQSSNFAAVLNNSDRRHENEEMSSLLPIQKVTGDPIQKIKPTSLNLPHLQDETLKNSGLEYENREIFSRKRQRLLHLASEALSIGVDEFASRGDDLIADLLRRLGVEMDSCLISKSTKTDLDFSLPRASQKSDNHFKKDSPKGWSKDMEGLSHFSPWDSDVAHQDISEFGRSLSILSNFDAQETSFRSSIRQSNSTLFNRDRYFRLDHMPFELDLLAYRSQEASQWLSPDRSLVLSDKFSFRDEALLAREHTPQLLGWDDKSTNCELHTIISCPTAQLSLNTTDTGSTALDDHLTSGSPSSLAVYPSFTRHRELLPGPSSQKLLSVYPITTLDRYLLEDGDYPVEEPDCFPNDILDIRDSFFLNLKISNSRFLDL